MNENNLVLLIVLMALVTFLTRFPTLLIGSRVNLPAWMTRGLKMAAVGVFTSLTIPPLLFHRNEQGLWSPEYLIAGTVALAVGVWRKQVIFSLAAGVLSLILIRSI